jgi:hypothetical protein
MKKPLSSEAQLKEAAFWAMIRTAALNDPAKSCLK